jgi:hypothetical protein
MALQFKPEFHEYISTDGDDIKWTSVTSLISKFKAPFDADAIANKVCKSKKSKWFGMKPEDIKEAWKAEAKRATDLGTWYHNQREADICGLSTLGREGMDVSIYIPNVDIDGTKTAPDQKLVEGIYPEHMVYLKSVGLCGQSDYVEVVNKKVNIIDYKTNKEIKLESFKGWDGKSQKMQPPFAHLDDCNFNHYALQLSIYMYIIIKHNPLYKPGSLTLQHVIFEEVGRDKYDNPISAIDSDGNPIVKEIVQYDVPYLKQEVITLINHLKDGKNKS